MKIDITQIDPNFLIGTTFNKPDIVWMSVTDVPFSIHGLAVTSGNRFWRLPENLIDNVNSGVSLYARNTAGGRIRFRTDSPYIAYRAKPLSSGFMPHMPLTGNVGTDLFVNGISTTTFRPNRNTDEWYEGILEIGEDVANMQGMKNIELNMGLYNGITEGYIGLKSGCTLEAPSPYTIEKPIVYYGNSVTQGGCASKPGNSFPAILGRWLNADHINLGFSGSGCGEENIAHYIASLDMSLFFMDYDHNAPTTEHLKRTHYPFYKIIRNAQPNLPIIISTMPNSDMSPSYREERFWVIKETYDRALAEGDENVYFIDGRTLFGDTDRDSCTMDGAHPNDLGFYRMAQNILPYMRKALGL